MYRFRRHGWTLLATVGMALVMGSLFGCAGIVAVARGSSEFQLEQPAFASQHALSSYHRGLPATAERFLSAFGEPDEVIALGPRREQWRYRTGLRLHGVALLLIVVPLPLLIPTGVHDTYVEIEQGTVVQVRGSQNSDIARIGCMVGPIATMFGDGGCFAKRGTPPNRARLGSGVLWLGPPPTLRNAPVGPRRGRPR
jgi:hypothetical protein